MSFLASLKAADSLQSFSALLKFKPKSVAYLLYKKPAAVRYHSFKISKKSGGLRNILSPADDLKLLQRRLSNLLQQCILEANQVQGWDDSYVHAFTKERSIISNAICHRNNRFVFNLDLEDFFETINFGRVRGFFIKNRTFQLHSSVATVIAQIACHAGSLPQGSPCSPVISNLVGHILDVNLCRIASSARCTYTRYADDITFSTNRNSFPSEIAKEVGPGTSKWIVGDAVANAIARSGFRVNNLKTRMQFRRSRQDVTGLVVNRVVNTRIEYRSVARVMAHRLFQTGEFQINSLAADAAGILVRIRRDGNINQLRGILEHIYRVDFKQRHSQANPQTGAAPIHLRGTARDLLYLRFLLFQDFYAAPKPTILCEGKTDPTYIRCALKSRFAQFPRLATDKGGKTELSVRLFRYEDSSLAQLMGVQGGIGAQCKFIATYLKSMAKFKTAITPHPVILLVDQDSGGRAVYKTAKEHNATVRPFAAEFTWIAANLYLVCTPLNGAAESVIEDSFTPATRNMKFNGKTFSPENDYDTDSHYGKATFANLIAQHRSTIDFSGFDVLLSRIDAVLKAHEAKLAAAGIPTPRKP